MTVIAFDGRTVAADKQATTGSGFSSTVTKIFRASDGAVLAVSGYTVDIIPLVAWYNAGQVPDQYPKPRQPDDCSTLTVFTPDGRILSYESGPFPMVVEDRKYADGSGRHAAMAAMLAGADARAAVEIACSIMADCGRGIDVLELACDTGGTRSARPARAGSAASGDSEAHLAEAPNPPAAVGCAGRALPMLW